MAESEERYDIRDLDRWLDQIKAGNADTDEEILELTEAPCSGSIRTPPSAQNAQR